MKLAALANHLGATLHGDPDAEITSAAGLEDAGPGQLTFVANPKYISLARATRATAVLVEPAFETIAPATLRITNPYLAFARALELFYTPPAYPPGIHPTAIISHTAQIGPEAHIGAYVVVGDHVTLGPHATLLPHVVLYPHAHIGAHFFAHAHAIVREHCRLGDYVTLQNGAIIGADGFGFARQSPTQELSSRPERSAVERPAVPAEKTVISTEVGALADAAEKPATPSPSELSSRPERSAAERPAVPAEKTIISTGVGAFAAAVEKPATPSPSELSSRPERSEAEGPAVATPAWYKILQTGPAVLEDHVEVQANSTIDRASIGETRIHAGAKIDNLVQVGHGSSVGADTLLCAQVGLAGSTHVGKNVILAGQVGVAGHCTIGDGAIATAQSGIPSDVAPGATVSGYPAIDNRKWLRSVALFNRLPEIIRGLRKIGQLSQDKE